VKSPQGNGGTIPQQWRLTVLSVIWGEGGLRHGCSMGVELMWIWRNIYPNDGVILTGYRIGVNRCFTVLSEDVGLNTKEEMEGRYPNNGVSQS